jgi:hypothetical protein
MNEALDHPSFYLLFIFLVLATGQQRNMMITIDKYDNENIGE